MSYEESRVAISTSELSKPYLLFLGDADDLAFLKTALGLRDWAPELCIAEWKCPQAKATIDLPIMSPRQAYEAGARALVTGAASIGGTIPASWIKCLKEALEAGLDLISGAHDKLADIPELVELANKLGRTLFDVRCPPARLPIATGHRRTGKRLLTVGTDCALGKKYTALTLASEFRKRGVAADFRASGQTGIMIAGAGIPIDSVPSDFIAGAAELLSPDAAPDHWDVIEGQGSVFHPSYAGVSLGLLHGSQPDVIILCHEAGRERIMGLEEYSLPSAEEAIDLTLRLGRRTNPDIRCAGISLNTASLTPDEAERAIASYGAGLGLPVADPMRPGEALDRLVQSCLA